MCVSTPRKYPRSGYFLVIEKTDIKIITDKTEENDIIIITKKICICISSRYDYAAKEEVKEEKIF